LFFVVCTMWPVHLFFHKITLIILVEEYKSWSVSLCIFLHSPVADRSGRAV
jgi:hypothetical protein